MTNAAYIDTAAIKASYAPYHTLPGFETGYTDYLANRYRHREFHGVDGQAYDRGQNAAMRVTRAQQWVEQNVGAN